MTSARFNELLATLGSANHKFVNLRLALALRVVVHETGEAGDRAFENFCARGVAVASHGEGLFTPVEE